MLHILQLRRASVLDSTKNDSAVTPADDEDDFPPPDNDDFAPFDDDEEPAPPGRDSASRESLHLSHQQDDSLSRVSVGGLDVSNNTVTPKKRKRSSTRPRKRRKVVIDNENTELTTQHIRNMLADTSDLVQENVHPSAWVPDKESVKNGSMRHMQSNRDLLLQHLSYERLFCRPGVGDDGQLAPALLDLWADNTAVISGKPSPYVMRQEQDKDAESLEDVEVARQERDSLPDDMAVQHEEQDDFAPPADDDEFPMDDDAPPAFDDDDANMPPQDDSGFAHDMHGMSKYLYSL